MKNVYSIIVVMSFFSSFYAQIGINTANPTNALHVFSTANPLRLEGLQTGSVSNNLLTVDASGVVKQNTAILGLQQGSYFAQGTTQVNIVQGTTALIPGVTITFTPSVNVNALVTVGALPLSTLANNAVQGSIDLLLNGTKISSQYYSATDGFGLVTLGNFSTTSRMVQLNAGTAYTFSVQAKSWVGETRFNVNPFPGYGGSTASDGDSMKSIMTIILFTR